MNTRIAFAIVLLASSVADAQQEEKPIFPSWVYPCPRAATPPKIDGKLDDPVYARAPVAGGFIDYHNPTKYVTPPTTFQIVHHGNSLFFAVRCEEPEVDDISDRPPKGRDAVLAIGETVEVFLDPTHGHNNYYQWIPSIQGDLYDANRLDQSWDSTVHFKTLRGDGEWTMEMEIPLGQIGLQGLTQWQIVGLRVCRNRWIQSSKYWSSWSAGGFHDAKTFDHLVICDESGEIPEDQIEALMPEFRRENDSKVGPVLVARSTGPGGETFANLGSQAVGKARRRLAEIEAMAAFLQKKAQTLRGELSAMEEKAPKLHAGSYPVFVLDNDELLKRIEAAYWTSRTDALLHLISSQKKRAE